ncbi:CDP-alcohol phosphatidyltransferase family protein [Tepidamorphus sp. 3E244]|uniref:CDP-alcohol phosphatidyltransferase family protein n=1 Tax=Tepidamorphus sp. 3E244 TaxID=3385498 RepID=UPI0038FCB641
MTIPNFITILRLAAVPLVVYATIQGWYLFSFIVFVCAAISDALDGYIAKRFDQSSELGAYLDPVADKALFVSLFVTLAAQELVPVWLAVLVVSRDAFIVTGIGVAALMDRPMPIDPLHISRANTAAQGALIALVLASVAFPVQVGQLLVMGTAAVTILTVGSALGYLAAWMRHLSD